MMMDWGAIQQTGGNFYSNGSDVGGANYFDGESRIMHLVSISSRVDHHLDLHYGGYTR